MGTIEVATRGACDNVTCDVERSFRGHWCYLSAITPKLRKKSWYTHTLINFYGTWVQWKLKLGTYVTLIDLIFITCCFNYYFPVGKARCTWCDECIKYGGGGKTVIRSHAKTKKHQRSRNTVKNSQNLPSVFQRVAERVDDGSLDKDHDKSCNLSYGAAPNTHGHSCSSDPASKTVSQNVNFWDRVSHGEARTLSFVAEHSLPLSITPHLIEYAREMSQDRRALDKIAMGRTSVTYKLTDGLSEILHKRLVNTLKEVPFSINIDECTAKNNQKVLSILVAFYSEVENSTVVYPLASITLKVVSAEVVYQAVCKVFEKENIPYTNLISILSDSAAYMRGKTSGFETLMRERKAPHLLDIDGDLCHHTHNSVKLFCSPFDQIIEQLCDDLYRDMKCSPDLKDLLTELCEIYNCTFHTPKERVPHRWLSVLDVSEDLLQMLPAILSMYYSYVPKQEKYAYKDLLPPVPAQYQARIKVIRGLCDRKFKASTPAGKERKRRIMKKLFYDHSKTLAYLNLYHSILPMFKSFVLILQQSSPMVHRLHDEITSLVQSFLTCFCQHEEVRDATAKTLQKLEVDNCLLPVSDFFTGVEAEECIRKLPKQVQDDIMSKLKDAYISTGKYLINKMPLGNRLLQRLGALDPMAMGFGVTYSVLRKLPRHFSTVLVREEMDLYEREISMLQLDKTLLPTQVDGQPIGLDTWWGQVLKGEKYQILAKVVKAALSIFTGPKIEQSFSIMNRIINEKTNRLDITTNHAYQNVKFHLKSKKTTTLQHYKRTDILKSPLDKSLCYHMQSASGRRKMKEKKARAKKAKQKKEMLSTTAAKPKKKDRITASKVKKHVPVATKLKKKKDIHYRAKSIKKAIKIHSKKGTSKTSRHQ